MQWKIKLMTYLKAGIEMKNNQSGFSLLEVLIALTIFGLYATVYISTQSGNLGTSIRMSNDLKLHNLAEMKMNEALIGKREFTNATKNDVDSGSFEISGYETYKYEVTITPIEFPSFEELMGKTSDESSEENKSDPLQQMIFEKLKKNMEEIIWQIKVKIIDTISGDEYELNSWINKSNAKIDTNFNL